MPFGRPSPAFAGATNCPAENFAAGVRCIIVLVQPFHEAPPAKWPFVSTSRIACPTLTFYNETLLDGWVSTSRIACPTLTFYNETLLDGWVSLSSQVAFWPTV